MKFQNILVSGCSFSAGYGMPGKHSDKNNWPNLLAKELGINAVTNVSRTGSNNHWIFLETVSAMLQDHYDLILVQWSTIPRFKFKVGLELYPVDTMLDDDINIVGRRTIKKEWLIEIKNRLLEIHNDHWDILDLVKYVNVLIELQVRARHGKIFFINGLGPWPHGYFDKKQIDLPSDLDPFTHDLLQAEFRDDDEIFQLYSMIHDHYAGYGSIQQQHWLNLYQAMSQIKIDTIQSNDAHPGLASQSIFADLFAQQITNKCIPLQL
jgi:hypothetical protein